MARQFAILVVEVVEVFYLAPGLQARDDEPFSPNNGMLLLFLTFLQNLLVSIECPSIVIASLGFSNLLMPRFLKGIF